MTGGMTKAMEGEDLLQKMKAATSIDGSGLSPIAEFEQKFEQVIIASKPSAEALFIAASIPSRENDGRWREAIVRALNGAMELRLTHDQIAAQKELAASNDRLGKKMLFAAWAGVAVACVGVVITIIQLISAGHS